MMLLFFVLCYFLIGLILWFILVEPQDALTIKIVPFTLFLFCILFWPMFVLAAIVD